MKHLLISSLVLLTLVFSVSAQTTNPPTRFRRLAAAPNCTITGMVYYNTGDGKVYVCTVVGTPGTWVALEAGAGSGDVTGPASATDNAVARFNGTGGKTLKNSAVTIASLLSSASLTGVTHMTLQANGAKVYVRMETAGSAASSTNYGISLAVGEKIDLYSVDWAMVNVQGTSATVSALCYSATV